MRTRQYIAEIVGGAGNVLTHHISLEDLHKRFEAAGISGEENVKTFLQHTTYDKDGYVYTI